MKPKKSMNIDSRSSLKATNKYLLMILKQQNSHLVLTNLLIWMSMNSINFAVTSQTPEKRKDIALLSLLMLKLYLIQ